MKKLFLFLALLSTSSVLAQSAKVLICAPGNLNAAKVTDSSLRKFYHDKIDLTDTLTDAINNYEAVFFLRPLTPEAELLLRRYLRSNKKLYLELFPGMQIVDSNSLWKFIGVDGIGVNELFHGVQYVVGIPGTFTEGLNIYYSKYDRVNPILPTGFGLFGKVAAVLTTTDNYNPSGVCPAYMYETDSFKVIIHTPIIPDYYDAFLGRVICNYFGLCEPLSADKKSSQQTGSSMQIYPNPAKDFLNIQYDAPYLSPLNLDIVSSMGSVVANKYIDQNTNGIFTLFLTDGKVSALSSGTYILRLTSNKEVLSLPFYIK